MDGCRFIGRVLPRTRICICRGGGGVRNFVNMGSSCVRNVFITSRVRSRNVNGGLLSCVGGGGTGLWLGMCRGVSKRCYFAGRGSSLFGIDDYAG